MESNLEIKKSIEIMKDEFKKSLPAHIKVDKFIRAAQSAALTNPKLINSDKAAFFNSCMKAAQVGLLVDGVESAIVEFKGKASFIPMIEGLKKLVRNSGEIINLTSDVVYEKDQFEYYFDEKGQHIKHSPQIFGDRGKVIGAYSAALTRDQVLYVAVMSLKEIEAVEAVSRAANGPWKGPFRNEMIKKTVFKRLYKSLPKSTDLDQDLLHKAIQEDEEVSFEPQQKEEPKKAKPLSRLKEMIKKEEEESEPEVVDAVGVDAEEII
jgi:recombination protein RecT